MVVNDTNIYQKMRNKTLLSIEENIKKLEKKPDSIIIRNLFHKVMTKKVLLMKNILNIKVFF